MAFYCYQRKRWQIRGLGCEKIASVYNFDVAGSGLFSVSYYQQYRIRIARANIWWTNTVRLLESQWCSESVLQRSVCLLRAPQRSMVGLINQNVVFCIAFI